MKKEPMGNIVLQFVGTDKDLGSLLIQWFGKGPYSHVDSVLPDGSLLGARNNKIGDIPAGVQIRPASYVNHERKLRVTIPCKQSIADAYYDFQKAQIGKPYDRLAILAFVFNRHWMDDDAWFCSELSTAGLVHCGLLPHLSVQCNKVDPDMEIAICSVLPGVTMTEVHD